MREVGKWREVYTKKEEEEEDRGREEEDIEGGRHGKKEVDGRRRRYVVAGEGRSEEALDHFLILHSRTLSCPALPCTDMELTAIEGIVSVYHSNATYHLKCR